MSAMDFLYCSFGKTHQPALYFFDRNARVPTPAQISFDARLGTVQQLFRPQTGNDDKPEPRVDSGPGSFAGYAGAA